MNTEQAYDSMAEANRIIEDFSMGKHAFYTMVFLFEIAACFAVFYMM